VVETVAAECAGRDCAVDFELFWALLGPEDPHAATTSATAVIAPSDRIDAGGR
jgi:hypothetical protein